MPNKDFKTWKTFSWKCSFYVSAWQTRLLQVSRTTVSTGKWVNTFFFSIVFSPFFLLENNSKQTNCEKAEDPSVQPFSVFTCFVFFGTCRVKPAAFAARLSDEQRADVHYDIIRREWDVWVHSARQDAPINRQRGQSERVEGHSVQQRRISRHSGNKQYPRQPDAVPPAHHQHIAITLFFFLNRRFIHLIVCTWPSCRWKNKQKRQNMVAAQARWFVVVAILITHQEKVQPQILVCFRWLICFFFKFPISSTSQNALQQILMFSFHQCERRQTYSGVIYCI